MTTSPDSPRHPRGLATLFFTEMWERFSYYGMRGLLVLFLVDAVQKGGMGMSDKVASAIYGLYTAAVYLAALPGGWVADRFLGAQRSVWHGGILIALGQFTLAFSRGETFYLGLVLVVLGTGLLKPNVSAIVGGLYGQDDPRRDAGFSIFYMGINLGAFVGPLVSGYLSKRYNWHVGFGAAGVGMVLGLVQYRLSVRRLGSAGLLPGHSEKIRRRDWATLGAGLAVLLAVVVLAWSGRIIVGSSLFADQDVRNLSTLASKLRTPAGPPGEFLRGHLSAETLEMLNENAVAKTNELRAALVQDLNRLLQQTNEWSHTQPWLESHQSERTRTLARRNPHGSARIRLHRWQMEDAFPDELARLPAINPVLIAQGTTYVIVGVAVAYFAAVFLFFGLDPVEKKRVGVIAILFVASAMFWSGFEQAGSSFNLFAERYTQRILLGAEVPASWFQSLGPLFIITLAPVMAAMWMTLVRRNLEPSLPVKFALGLLLLGAGFVVMAVASRFVAAGQKVWPTWLITTYFVHSVAELCLSPVGLSSVTKLAPQRLVGQMMGVWFLAASLGNLIAGLIAGEFNAGAVAEMSSRYFHVVWTAVGTGVVLLVLAKPIRRLMAGVR
jgi:proton-dependent oligopeptide transporter, POT family